MSNHELIKTLRRSATEIVDDGINGWGNTMNDAADALEAMEWQPIETAPKDGSGIKLLTPVGQVIGAWEDRVDDSPDQPGHNAGWYGVGYKNQFILWGRTREDGFAGEDSYLFDPTNQPTHWVPLPSLPEEE